MGFFQAPPRPPHAYDHDPLLREYHDRVLPPELVGAHREVYRHLGALATGELYDAMLAERELEPVLTPFDAWGHRVDHIEVTPLWKRAERLAAEHGLVAAGYDGALGAHARVHQFSLNYLVQASLDIHSCPLAMTDGAARTLLDAGAPELIERALPHLLSRDPATFWTSGQWMTERTGGSDVGLSETVARPAEGGFRLFGTKWFTSATTAQMALTLARPEGNPAGGRGLALFYVEPRGPDGRLDGIRVNRLKDKLGTRKVPTAELTLDGVLARPVAGTRDGIKHIASMLNVTRTWNAAASAWMARRAVALARDYAARRFAFGAMLERKPLHVDTLAGMTAESEGLFLLAFRAVELLGRVEAREATDEEQALLRALTPIAKLTTAKQAVAITSEMMECFGGAGYVEDTGLPRLHADAQVLPIWEGTTNVLSLDVRRALEREGAAEALHRELEGALGRATRPEVEPAVRVARAAHARLREALTAPATDAATEEAGARRLALTLGRTLALAHLAAPASWCLEHGRGDRAAAAARRFAAHGVDLVSHAHSAADAARLVEG
jgi:acyl-CoA dehydrogenase